MNELPPPTGPPLVSAVPSLNDRAPNFWQRRRISAKVAIVGVGVLACLVTLGAALRDPEDTLRSSGIVAPDAPITTDAPVVTPAPVTTQVPVTTEVQVTTEAPVPTEAPVVTEPPVITEPPPAVLAKLGDTGVNVELAQRTLVVLGHLVTGTVDAVWGSATQQAWERLELSGEIKLNADGVFTSDEAGVIGGYASLYVAPPVTAPPTLPPPPPATVAVSSAECQGAIRDALSADRALAANPLVSVRDDYSGRYVEVPNRNLSTGYTAALRYFSSACASDPTVSPDTVALAQPVIGCLSNWDYRSCASQNNALLGALR